MNAGADDAARFESYRTELSRHAYRMLGDRAEAEDAVQDAYLRWTDARERGAVAAERAFLRTIVTRLCIDRLRSARARREVYAGPWLPEPVVTATAEDPEAAVALSDDVSFALLLALERLSALERAAFLLHDVMDVSFAEIAETLGRSEAAVKTLASRARVHIRDAREPRIARAGAARAAAALRERFALAIARDDLSALLAVLADDVVFIADSGGRVPAAMVPVRGRDRVGRLLLGLAKKAGGKFRIEAAELNHLQGFVIFDGVRVEQTLALQSDGERISAIYVTRDPEKLRLVAIGP